MFCDVVGSTVLGQQRDPEIVREVIRSYQSVCDQVIRQYLSPMPPFGPEGEGWPLGRAVRAAELEAAALQIEGVLYVNGVEVAGRAADGTWARGTVHLEKWQSAEVIDVTELRLRK